MLALGSNGRFLISIIFHVGYVFACLLFWGIRTPSRPMSHSLALATPPVTFKSTSRVLSLSPSPPYAVDVAVAVAIAIVTVVVVAIAVVSVAAVVAGFFCRCCCRQQVHADCFRAIPLSSFS